MPPPFDPEVAARRARIVEGLRGRGIERAVDDEALWKDLNVEARSGDPENRLVGPDFLAVAEQARGGRVGPQTLGLFNNTNDAIIVPGFLGSELVDAGPDGGVVWVSPRLLLGPLADTGLINKLKLAAYKQGSPDRDDGEAQGVSVRPKGAVPALYDVLKLALEIGPYAVQVFGFDWRKAVDESAGVLANLIRDRAKRPFRPLHLIAHSQGTIVARRAVQLLGADLGRRLVSNLVLLGPATAGTFASAFAFAGQNGLLETVRRFGIKPPPGFKETLQSMSGLYQLLPWRRDAVDDASANDPVLKWVRAHAGDVVKPAFWAAGIDPARLADLYGWGQNVDATFLNDRTTLILGDTPTVGGVRFNGNVLEADPAFTTSGDGTVPDALARVDGVSRVFKAKGAEHMMLPATLSVIEAVKSVLAGKPPAISRVAGLTASGIPFLAVPEHPLPVAPPAPVKASARKVAPAAETLMVDPPAQRRLRVFSCDPLFATDPDALGVEQVTITLPWNFADGDHLRPGPIGEYVEVIDFDPASGCFYPPADLNDPHALAQDGLPVSEGDPRFHQQMAYAVSMATVQRFEAALGRVALWAPHLERDPVTRAVKPSVHVEDEFVRRLRIYPHGLREANAYYHPDKKALLLGYFPASGTSAGRNLPGGMVFASLSYDIIAHETTHALLDGVHRYLTEPSNPDVFAFHEAFADVVALFQHFTHPEVLRHEIASTRGDLRRESTLGVLAAQFGEATGRGGALRQYLGKKDEQGNWGPVEPDKGALARETEPHARGAVLVAAIFGAFRNIYEGRVKALRRIATGGTGVLPDGDLHPDLVDRMADEAATAARHLLTMCVRAIDYIPPVDLTFGEYLRALITADFELVHDDDLRYRVSVVSAFRDWGIYPTGVRSLSVDSLLWSPPEVDAFPHEIDFFRKGLHLTIGPPGAAATAEVGGDDGWNRRSDRLKAFVGMRRAGAAFHGWLADPRNLAPGRDRFLGLALGADAPKSIPRDAKGRPVFEVHSLRPCRRIGPDGEQRADVVVEVVQRRLGYFDPGDQAKADAGTLKAATAPDFSFRGGCTLVIDPDSGDIRYCVRKAVRQDDPEDRLDAERAFRLAQSNGELGVSYLSDGSTHDNPFRLLHGGW